MRRGAAGRTGHAGLCGSAGGEQRRPDSTCARREKVPLTRQASSGTTRSPPSPASPLPAHWLPRQRAE